MKVLEEKLGKKKKVALLGRGPSHQNRFAYGAKASISEAYGNYLQPLIYIHAYKHLTLPHVFNIQMYSAATAALCCYGVPNNISMLM